MHLLLTGGGTAGHVMPNIALIESLKKASPAIQISYIGSQSGIEVKLLKDLPLEYFSIKTGKLRRYFDIQNLFDLFNVLIGCVQAFKILSVKKPDLVFSKGGYVALPVVFAAFIQKIPVIIHESDSIPGLTTKLTSFLATEVWATANFLPKKQSHKFRKVFLPIRTELFKGDKNLFMQKYKLDASRKTILIMGGSLGAQAINDFIISNLTKLLSEYNLIHITGKGKLSQQEMQNYLQVEYIDSELASAYQAADIVVSRSGAIALSELGALNKKVVLIPLPKTQSRGEQLINAENFVQNHSALIIQQAELDYASFKLALKTLFAMEPKKTTKLNNAFDPSLILRFAGQKKSKN